MLSIFEYFDKELINVSPMEININPFYETLVDLIFRDINIFNKDHEQLIDDIEKFCKKNNIKVQVNESNIISGKIVKTISGKYDYIEINYNSKYSIEELLDIFLHELSHYITLTSSNNKLVKFITDPDSYLINVKDIDSLKREINYLLSPAESANWAFTISLEFFRNGKILPNELYSKIKNDIKLTKFDIFKSEVYNELSNNLKTFYKIVFYVFSLKNLTSDYKLEMNRLNHFMKLVEKYLKRLKRIHK